MRTLVIALDLSPELLRLCLVDDSQRVNAALPHLPLRKNSSNEIICIAVIHHIRSVRERIFSLQDLIRVYAGPGEIIITVWRKWRESLKQQIFQRIRENKEYDDLVNHERPWKTVTGKILVTRFYHYYTKKELIREIKLAGFTNQYSITTLDGKAEHENFLVRLK